MPRELRVAVIGAGPAGTSTARALAGVPCSVDLFDRAPGLPAGLPDRPGIRWFGGVEYGRDLALADVRSLFDAVVVATGRARGRDLVLPGLALPGSRPAAEFARSRVARAGVIGPAGLALDVARVLAARAVGAGDVHVFTADGPGGFTPGDLRELDEVPGVAVVVDPEEVGATGGSPRTRAVLWTLREWAARRGERAPWRLHLHVLAAPVAVLGTSRVTGLRTERLGPDARRTGELTDHPLDAVYRAAGATALPELPLDRFTGTLPHRAGRVLDLDGQQVPGVYAAGSVAHGGSREAARSLIADAARLAPAPVPHPAAVPELLAERGVGFTTRPVELPRSA